MARIKYPKIKFFLFKNALLSLIFLLESCSNNPIVEKKQNTNPLLLQYKMLRLKNLSNGLPQSKNFGNKKVKKQSSPSTAQLDKNPIYQQVTQIHCFKIRASESKCAAIKYLAFVNCGEINKETQINQYSKCLETHFK